MTVPASEWAAISRDHALEALRTAVLAHGRELFIDRESRSIAVVLTQLTAAELGEIETLAKRLFSPNARVTVTCALSDDGANEPID